jgi:dolichol-phosphate mannosyltransferase
MSLEYSIVIPLKNEEENLRELIEEIVPVMESLQKSWEMICIDDGSTDGTKDVLMQLQNIYPQIRPVFFDRNYGQSSAFDAGFHAARGTFVITLDGDRQNDPRDIPRLIDTMGEADLICGWRAHRQDTFVKKITSRLANFVRSRFCRDGVRDTGCSLKIYRRSSLKKIKMFNGMHRFLPALFLIEGFKITETPVNHRQRTKGTTKYNFFNRSFNTIADMLAVRWMSKRHLSYRIVNETSPAEKS